jgi:hypothetical protein
LRNLFLKIHQPPGNLILSQYICPAVLAADGRGACRAQFPAALRALAVFANVFRVTGVQDTFLPLM